MVFVAGSEVKISVLPSDSVDGSRAGALETVDNVGTAVDSDV